VTLADVTVTGEGTVCLFQPLTHAAEDWMEEHVVGETQWFGSALCVEHRYAGDLAQGMQEDELRLE
jgi:hypothetical protein